MENSETTGAAKPAITLPDAAREALRYFTRGEREADGIGKILLPVDGAPEWVDAMCRAAHDDCQILPDDWRYEFVGDALDHLAELDEDSDPRDTFREWLDGAYIYTNQQTAWLHSRTDRYAYCQEAADDYGGEMDFCQMLAAGLSREAEEVFEVVLAACESQAEEVSHG